MSMTLGAMIELLTDLRDGGMDEDTPVLLATQPTWPLAYEVDGVACSRDFRWEAEEGDPMPEEAVWITEGEHPQSSPYAPAAAWAVAETR